MTKAATIETHRFLCLVVLAAMLIAMIPIGVAVFPYSVLADNTSTVTGNFTVNNGAPIVDNVTLHFDGGGSETGSMNPYTDNYEVWVGVTENGTFATIDNITVTIFYSADAAWDNDAPGTYNNNTCAIITYTNGSPDTWVLSNAGGTTWGENNGSTSGDGETSGYFVFEFRPGKVARETADPADAAEWQIYAVAYDSEGLSDSNYAEDLEMNWYGEITGVDTTTTFGDVNLGATADQSSAIDATYISNGAFDEQVQTEATWDSATVQLDLDPSGSPASGDFSLQADDDTGVPAASWVTTSYTSFATDDTANDTFTAETGHITTEYLFLTLANAGIPPDTYTGTVWLAITNATS